MKITIELSGFIKSEYVSSFPSIKLVQDNGYKIDLVSRFKEAGESYPNKKVQVSYYISNKKVTKIEMLEGWLNKLHGSIEADYETSNYSYSSWTNGTDYDTILKVGGHDFYKELQGYQDKFIIIEINFN